MCNLIVLGEFGQQFRGAQNIGHQGPTPAAKLDQIYIGWSALVRPNLQEPQPDHLAKDLRDFGCRHKISAPTDSGFLHIIPKFRVKQRLIHKLVHRKRA